jgi:hypothetical protein
MIRYANPCPMRVRTTTAATIVEMGQVEGYQQNEENRFDEECILQCLV